LGAILRGTRNTATFLTVEAQSVLFEHPNKALEMNRADGGNVVTSRSL
jgi:hypothetical protein